MQIIGYGQTISQPYIVALMCEAAAILPQDKVLEIGTGSGYQAAILSQLTQKVHTVEIVSPLGKHTREILKELNYNNVYVKIGDGYSGWSEHAPYNVILITAATENVPQPLMEQLAINGRLIIPLGSGLHQELVRFTKTVKGLKKESLGTIIFVPFQRSPL
jgi:protein-L-isoaspartate(D-aspartate) O-methyltransferase